MSLRGRQTITIVERVEIGHGDWADGPTRVRSFGWSVQPMPPEEQEQAGLQIRRRWRAVGPPVEVPGTYQVEVDGLVDPDGVLLRLDVHGALEVWPNGRGRRHHAEGVLTLVEGEAR